jgi:hypothetical protein
MAIIGSLIKTALDINKQLSSLPENAREIQLTQLKKLLNQAKNTSFGLYHGFAQILEAKDPIAAFQKQVPLHDYNKLHRKWWGRQQDYPNITWPGQPKYFALSSGTTGKTSKRIPVTDDMLASFRAVGQSQVAALANFDIPSDFFEKDILMLGSSAELSPYKHHREGEISGINTMNIPGWFQSFYKPGKEIAKISDWDERVAAIAKAAPDWDVVAIAGIPSWVRMMILKIMEVNKLKTIHDVWPNLTIYASGGVAFAPHRKSFEKLLAKPLVVMDTYLASEGFFAFTARPDTMAMQLAVEHNIFYEFIPFDERGFDGTGQMIRKPLVLNLGEVEEGQDYALIVSSPAGAWRYLVGDTIKFTNLSKYEIVISGRTKYYLNVVGSQLSEEKLNAGIAALSDKLGVMINEFAVAAVQVNGEYIHQWVLGTNVDIDEEKAAQELDKLLQGLNKNYKVARSKALKGVRLKAVRPTRLYNWLEESKRKKGGQIKLPKVMKEEMMLKLLSHLAK